MWAKIQLAYQVYLLLRAVWPHLAKVVNEVEQWYGDREAGVLEDNAKLNEGVKRLKAKVPNLSTPEAQTVLNAELIKRQKGARR